MFERFDPRNWTLAYETILEHLVVLGGAIVAALAIHWVLFALLKRIVQKSDSQIDDIVFDTIKRPLRWAMVGFAISVAAENDARGALPECFVDTILLCKLQHGNLAQVDFLRAA